VPLRFNLPTVVISSVDIDGEPFAVPDKSGELRSAPPQATLDGDEGGATSCTHAPIEIGIDATRDGERWDKALNGKSYVTVKVTGRAEGIREFSDGPIVRVLP